MAEKALIVVDVQRDFIPGGALPVPRGDEVVPVVNALLGDYGTVVLTADWHPADHCSFAASHAGKAVYDTVALPYGEQVLWPVHCVAGTSGAEFAPGLDTTRAAAIVRKGMRTSCDSYSGFLEADRATATGLAGYLRERGVTEVFVCGLALDFCVAYTALDAAAAGFATSIIVEASRPIFPDCVGKNRRAWEAAGVRLA